MKKRVFASFLCCICMVSMLAVNHAALAANEPGMSAFAMDCIPATTLTDVEPSAWYYNAVCYAQASGIVVGFDGGKYLPQNEISYAECITMAVRIYERYHGITPKDMQENTEDSWYSPYVRRAQAYGILPATSLGDTSSATREWMVALFYNTLPIDEFEAVFHYISLPDVASTNQYDKEIITFYNAGIVRGVDEQGTFHPSSAITRAEVAMILYTMLQPAQRYTSQNPKFIAGFEIDLNGLSCSFSDVASSAWYYQSVAAQQKLGLLKGVGNNQFAPNDTVTVAQALTAANRIHEKYHRSSDSGQEIDWMEEARSRAIAYGLISESQYNVSDLSRAATRQETIGILYHALDEEEYPALNERNTLPDMNADDACFDEILKLYRAGILSGSDGFGTFCPSTSITRAELAAILTRMVVPVMRVKFSSYPAEKMTYGYSGEYLATDGESGYPLTAYRIGNGKNVLLLTYCIHGTESANDSNAEIHCDGAILNRLAYQMVDDLKANYSTVKAGDWSVYIIPACNPDGLHYSNGKSSAVGRQTKYYYHVIQNEGGSYIKTSLTCDPQLRHGIDMNRSFDYNFRANTTVGDDCYCGVTPMQCPETEYLAAFAESIKGTGKNVVIDTHGWYSQILINRSSTRQSNVVYKAFYKQFGFNTTNQLQGSRSYFAAYCVNKLGYTEGCLFEMPNSVEFNISNGWTPRGSVAEMQEAFDRQNCGGRYKAAILEILKLF